MTLQTRATTLTERMDDPDCDPVRLRRTLVRFDLVNRLFSGWAHAYKTMVRPALGRPPRRVRVLDIGCGGGDVLHRIVNMARRDGFNVSGLGIDPDSRALAVARDKVRVPGIEFRELHSSDLVRAGERFDIVISNHLLHHLTDRELQDVLRDSEMLATSLALHSDIARGRLAYYGFAFAVTPIAPGTLLRVDGLRSIRRSYTKRELERVLPQNWSAQQPHRFRLHAVLHPEAKQQ